jgi:putative ABC transport system permease protein
MAPWWQPRARAEQQLSKEIAFHLAERVAELVGAGMDRCDAERQARRELGALDPILEGCRDQRWWRGLDDLARDMKYALRALCHAPVFSVVALVTLTLGIGANAALFQVYEALELRALPVADPASLTLIRITPGTPRNGNFMGRPSHLTSAQVDALRRTEIARDGLATWSSFRFTMETSGEARLVGTLMVSGDYFRVLGIGATTGRVLSTDDDTPGCGAGSAVISHAFWQREYGGRRDVLGQPVRVAGHAFQIVGVTPPSFSGLEVGYPFDVAVPLCAEKVLRGERTMTASRQYWWLAAAARLPEGQSLAARAARLEALSPALMAETLPPDFRPELAEKYLKFRLTALDASRGVSNLRQQFGQPLLLLIGVTGLVLLIACVNLANLLLARMSHRHRELAVRLAMGATRTRLAALVAAEAGLLVIGGTVLGVLISTPLARWLVLMLVTPDQPVHLDIGPNWPLLGCASALAVLVGCVSAVAPALRVAAMPPVHALRDGQRTTTSRRTLWWRRSLIVTEVALTFVLVVGAVLMGRSLGRLQSVELGFDPRGLVTTEIAFAGVEGFEQRRPALLDAIQERVAALPFVSAVSTLDYVPMAGSAWNDTLRVEGGGHPDTEAQLNRVGESYFAALGTPLVEGRIFTRADGPGSTPVAVVTRAFVARAFGGKSPLGRRVVMLTEPDRAYEIVGVVGDTKYGTLREDRQPVLFVPTRQQVPPGPFVSLVVRTARPAATIIPALTSAILDVDPSLTLRSRPLEETIADTLRVEHLLSRLSLFFGGLALLLAGVGLYGVIAYTAAQRQRDIGIRLALGAPRTGVVLQVVGQTAWMLAAGLILGAAACVPLSRGVESVIFGVTARDLVTYVLAGLTLGAVGLAAAWVPAWRAARMNPTSALRSI